MTSMVNRTAHLEEIIRKLEEDLLRRQDVEMRLAQVMRELENRHLELSLARGQALLETQERERLEVVLQHKTNELARSSRDLDQFASIAGHELQEPLHSLLIFIDLFHKKYASAIDDRGWGYLNRVKNAANRMQQLVQDLLVYSRVSGPSSAEAPLVLRQVVDEILSELGARIEELQAVIRIGALPTVHGHATHFRQLLKPLISNGLKFHQPGKPPVLHISGKIIQDRRHNGVKKPELLCQIEIHDQGIGIPAEHFNKIFGVFKRLHRRDEYEGTGIGLAVCRRIVEQCGGTISVQSRVGEGSSFIVTIPLRQYRPFTP